MLRRVKGSERAGFAAQRRSQPRDIEFSGDEVAFKVLALGVADGRVELDQHLADGDGRPAAAASRRFQARPAGRPVPPWCGPPVCENKQREP